MLFVEESIARGEIVPYEELKLFIDEDKPVLFHLHESLAEDRREKLHDSIMVRSSSSRSRDNWLIVVSCLSSEGGTLKRVLIRRKW